MKYILKTNKLLINSEKSQNNAFIYTGSPNKDQKEKGKLIIILEFPEDTKDAKELGNLLVQKIHKLYYSSALVEQESILENILEEVNDNLPLLTHIDNNWLKKFNAIIAIIYRQETYFSPVGDVSAWIANKKELINIFDYLENDDIEKPSADKIFTNILSGNIEANQNLIFTTNPLFDYISKEKVEDIVINNDPTAISIKLKEILFKITNRNFCLVSIKLSPVDGKNKDVIEEKAVEVPVQEIESENRLQKNIKISDEKQEEYEEEQTQENDKISEKPKIKFITRQEYDEKEIIEEEPPVGEFVRPKETYSTISSKESLDNLLSLQQKTENILKSGKVENEKTERIQRKKPIILQKILKFLWKIIKTIFEFLWKVISYPFILIKKSLAKSKFHKNSSVNLKNSAIIEGKIPKSKNKKKLILIFVIIFFVALVSSIFITQYLKKSKAEKDKYNQIINSITEKKSEYDLVSIYKDEKLAKEKLKEISDLINELPQKTDEQKKKYQEILDSFTETLDKIWNIQSIKNPSIIAQAPFYPEKIIKYNDSIIALGQNSSDIARINIKSKSVEQIGTSQIYNGITAYNKNQNFVYGLDLNNKIAKIDLDTKAITKLDIAYHPNLRKGLAISFYNDKLYILDPESNQIYKHNQEKDSFAKGEAWISDNTDIKNALCMSIDSNIYLGNNNGTMTVLYTGKSKTFTLQEINPIVKSINKIYTDNSMKEIYILDSQTKRIIAINKSGGLIKQYYFPTLNKLDDLIYDGATKTIYLQSENKIIEVK